MKYRKKPVVIEAAQWFQNGDHPEDYIEDITRGMKWEGRVVRYYRHPDTDGTAECKSCGSILHDHGWIDTLEGGHIVCPGDWIIKGVQGEFYPCKNEIFRATYEDVSDV